MLLERCLQGTANHTWKSVLAPFFIMPLQVVMIALLTSAQWPACLHSLKKALASTDQLVPRPADVLVPRPADILVPS